MSENSSPALLLPPLATGRLGVGYWGQQIYSINLAKIDFNSNHGKVLNDGIKLDEG